MASLLSQGPPGPKKNKMKQHFVFSFDDEHLSTKCADLVHELLELLSGRHGCERYPSVLFVTTRVRYHVEMQSINYTSFAAVSSLSQTSYGQDE